MEGNYVRLRELITDREFVCHSTSGYRGKKGNSGTSVSFRPWSPSLPTYHIVFTTPYVLIGQSKDDWIAYLKRSMVGIKAPCEADALHQLLKFGLSKNYWNEFVFLAYHHHQADAIFLAGIPDLRPRCPMREAILSESQAMSDKIRAKEINQAFPNLAEWVKGRGSIEIGNQDWQGFVVRLLDEGGFCLELDPVRFAPARHSLLWNGGCPRWRGTRVQLLQMTAHSDLLGRYSESGKFQTELNNLLSGRFQRTFGGLSANWDFFRRGRLVFGSEDEMSLLMDYCLYQPEPDRHSLVAKYLEKSPPSTDSDEMVALRAMTEAYYSLFQITDVEREDGVTVLDLLRDETGFIVDIGFGSTAQRHLMVADPDRPGRGLPDDRWSSSPVDASAARRLLDELTRMEQEHRDPFDFKRMTPLQTEAPSLVIRTCLSSGMSSHILYEEPGGQTRSPTGSTETARPGRNDPCPCGSGKKYKMCCGRR